MVRAPLSFSRLKSRKCRVSSGLSSELRLFHVLALATEMGLAKWPSARPGQAGFHCCLKCHPCPMRAIMGDTPGQPGVSGSVKTQAGARLTAKLRRAANSSLLVARSSSSLAVGAIGAGRRIIPWERGCPHPLSFSLSWGAAVPPAPLSSLDVCRNPGVARRALFLRWGREDPPKLSRIDTRGITPIVCGLQATLRARGRPRNRSQP